MEIWKKKLPELPDFLYENWNWYFVEEAVLGNFVCLWFACRISVSLLLVSVSELCFLEQTASCQLPLGKHFRGGPLVTAQQWGAEWLQAVNSCGIWEHLTPPEEHPAPWRIKPRILTWIHTNHVQPLSWLMITEMANNHIAFSWLPKDKPAWHLWPPCSSLLPVSCSHCLV